MNANNRKIHHSYKLCEGPTDITVGYGIATAAMVGFPEVVLQQAEHVKQFLQSKEDYQRDLANEGVEEGNPDAWKYSVLQRLAMIVKDTPSMSSDQIRQYLQSVRKQIDTSMVTAG